MKRAASHSFTRYLVVTALSFGLNVGFAALLVEAFGVEAEVAVAAAFVLVFFVNFFLMRHYIYRATGRGEGGGKRQMGLYVASAVGFRTGEYLAFLAAHALLALPYSAAQIGVLAVSALLKYVFYGAFVFRKKAATTAAT